MLQEYTRVLEEPIDSDRNLFSILQERAQRAPEDSLIEYAGAGGVWQSFTALQFRDKVVALAKGLIARGVMPGDCVAIIAHTSWQWTAIDMAIMSIGALTVPVYETNSPAQVRTIFNDANVSMAFAEDDMQRDKIELVRKDCAALKDIYVFGFGALDTIETFGRGVGDKEFEEREQSVKGSDLATIVYTSGSTGTPKGIELSHANFVFMTMSGIQTMPDVVNKPNRRLLLFLPLAHVFARYLQFVCFAGTVSLGLSSNMKTILSDFGAFKPTFILAVPRIFEKIYNAASQKAGAGFKGRIFSQATRIAREWSQAQQSGERIPTALQLQHAVYKKLVYSSIMAVFGGRVEYAVSGGAPLDTTIAHFFNGVGLPLLEGYGMTETCAPCTVNPTVGYQIGTVGLPFQGISVGIDDTGELCIKGRSICVGYHNHPEITAEQITDGWLHTGDLGTIDEKGFVRLTGRKKDLIITAGGKNVSPGEMEASVMTSPVVDQCVVVGDRKPFIAAIISLNLQETNLWLQSEGAETVADLDGASRNPIVYAEVERAVNKANELVSRAESIRKFEIVPDEFTEGNGMITPSLKAKRQVITDHYRELIDTVIYKPRRAK
ncbi:AMP-dependent synthetase/ligase [Bifidobacterium sp.]|jgi:long-chain acyl-CoA synthetase|uniref:AMP-dependent synthetase/ligase n=1 Tax=Bifidobacterium sp. TaxID=41200 RepID=UPI0025BD750C|nr:AMP-dependent synthetase/ligase [Bifidobacterium sp.]MCH4208587.1 AMP-dependent synthetase/ligase [Bifidobacterium sp.]MCI1224273.1 AMP-dependent synthetase/ligase [Bifidobacterium sp.]